MLVKCIDGPAMGDEYPVPDDYRTGAIVRVALNPPPPDAETVADCFVCYRLDGDTLRVVRV